MTATRFIRREGRMARPKTGRNLGKKKTAYFDEDQFRQLVEFTNTVHVDITLVIRAAVDMLLETYRQNPKRVEALIDKWWKAKQPTTYAT